MKIIRTSTHNPDFIRLVEALNAEFWERYGDLQASYQPLNVLPSLDTALVGYEALGPRAIACGCFKRYDENKAEIKRMYVAKDYRGKGFSKTILQALEHWAKEEGYSGSILETGYGQPEAIGLYRSAGYRQIPNYGPYVNLKDSICFFKEL
jgi:GNAT superfamily N-acetyltransferase